MAKPAEIVQDVQEMYKRCTISAQIWAKYHDKGCDRKKIAPTWSSSEQS